MCICDVDPPGAVVPRPDVEALSRPHLRVLALEFVCAQRKIASCVFMTSSQPTLWFPGWIWRRSAAGSVCAGGGFCVRLEENRLPLNRHTHEHTLESSDSPIRCAGLSGFVVAVSTCYAECTRIRRRTRTHQCVFCCADVCVRMCVIAPCRRPEFRPLVFVGHGTWPLQNAWRK